MAEGIQLEKETIAVLFADKAATDWKQVLTECGTMLTELGFTKPSFTEACIEREHRYPTGLPTEVGIAIPHAGSAHVNKSCLCIIRLRDPVMFRRIDDPGSEIPVKVVVGIAVASDDDQARTLARLVQGFQDSDFLNSLVNLDGEEVKALMQDWVSRPDDQA